MCGMIRVLCSHDEYYSSLAHAQDNTDGCITSSRWMMEIRRRNTTTTTTTTTGTATATATATNTNPWVWESSNLWIFPLPTWGPHRRRQTSRVCLRLSNRRLRLRWCPTPAVHKGTTLPPSATRKSIRQGSWPTTIAAVLVLFPRWTTKSQWMLLDRSCGHSCALRWTCCGIASSWMRSSSSWPQGINHSCDCHHKPCTTCSVSLYMYIYRIESVCVSGKLASTCAVDLLPTCTVLHCRLSAG